MNEREREAIERYIKQVTHSQEEARDALQEELIKLDAQIARDTLDLAEERVERYAKQGMSYKAALDTVIAELEERDLRRKLKEDERRREQTRIELQERGEA